MALTEYGEKQLADLEWENMQLKNAIIKHFLGIDLENRPSNRIIDIGEAAEQE
ncbi:MAG: hypothetical protein ACI4IR_06940 [Eubacterium sp.]